MIKWEYKILYPDLILRSYSSEQEHNAVHKADKDRINMLNTYGNRGWELVNFSESIAIFKRPIPVESKLTIEENWSISGRDD